MVPDMTMLIILPLHRGIPYKRARLSTLSCLAPMTLRTMVYATSMHERANCKSPIGTAVPAEHFNFFLAV